MEKEASRVQWQFKDVKGKEKTLKKQSIFEITSIFLDGTKQNRNGCIKTWTSTGGFHSSLNNAKKTMKEIGERESKNGCHVLGFQVEEHIIDKGYCGKWDEINQFDSIRLFDSNVNLISYCNCDSGCNKEFKGRDASTCKVSIGDVAWYWDGDELCPILIEHLPPSKERFKELNDNALNNYGEGINWDWGDDCYYAYSYDNGHEHAHVSRVFPFFGKISKKNMNRLIETKKWYDSGCPE